MDYKKLDRKIMRSWRIGATIGLLIILIIAAPSIYFLMESSWDSIWKYVIMGGIFCLVISGVADLIVFPQIKYRQWGYLVEEDRVIIKHGLFFIKTVIVPIIRVQNITVSQGPINRSLGLYKVEISLASGSFEIEGLDHETADKISENLKERLYLRIAEKGVL